MLKSKKINFIDLSVNNRNITSIAEEQRRTPHSLGYLNFLAADIQPTIIRFGANFEEDANYKLYRYKLHDLIKFYHYCKTQQNVVVLFHGFPFPIRFWLLRNLLGRKVKWIVQHHAGEPSGNWLKCFIQKLAYGKAAAYLFVTKAQAKNFIAKGLVSSEENVFEIMECSTHFQLNDKLTSRKQIGIDTNGLVFLWVGGLDKNKDPMTMLKATRDFKTKGAVFSLYLFYNRTDLLREVQDFIIKNNMESFVFLKGKIENAKLEDWYNAADFYIACSHTEGSSGAMAEATACGCIPLTSSIPSFLFMTDKGKVGMHFEKGNWNHLAEKLSHLDQIDIESERIKTQQIFKSKTSFEAIGIQTSEVIKRLNAQG